MPAPPLLSNPVMDFSIAINWFIRLATDFLNTLYTPFSYRIFFCRCLKNFRESLIVRDVEWACPFLPRVGEAVNPWI